jgi:imidazolonepropionase-like amidohydrolase
MNRAGVTLIAGSDVAETRVPGFTLQEELSLLAGCGLTPLQALQAATSNAVKVAKATADFGAVEAGKRADLVLLDANPLEDIRNTQRIAAVVFGGKLLRRADLDALLAEAEQLAKNN